MDFWVSDIRIQSAFISAVVSLVVCVINLRYNKKRDETARNHIILDTFKKELNKIREDAIKIWYTEPSSRTHIDIQLLISNLNKLLNDYTSSDFEKFYTQKLHAKTRTQLSLQFRQCMTLDIEISEDKEKTNHIDEIFNQILQSLNIR